MPCCHIRSQSHSVSASHEGLSCYMLSFPRIGVSCVACHLLLESAFITQQISTRRRPMFSFFNSLFRSLCPCSSIVLALQLTLWAFLAAAASCVRRTCEFHRDSSLPFVNSLPMPAHHLDSFTEGRHALHHWGCCFTVLHCH